MNGFFDPKKTQIDTPVDGAPKTEGNSIGVFNPAAFNLKTEELKAKQDADRIEVQVFDEVENLGDVRTWSFSALSNFEQCPLRIYKERVGKFRQPSSEAMERGNRVHKEAEDYIQGVTEKLPASLKKLKGDYEFLRARYAEGKVLVEDEWGFRSDWSPCGFHDDDVWLRAKLDALYRDSPTSAVVVDHKTGKKFGNESKHSSQGFLYALTTFLKYPELDTLKIEFWYTDHGLKLERTLSRETVLKFHHIWHNRAVKMTTCKDFIATPSKTACRWCYYAKEESEFQCPYAVR